METTQTLGMALALPKTANHHEWLQQRRAGIGSSDASAIVGLNPYKSPYALWEEKTGRMPLEVVANDRSEELMYWGRRLEPIVIAETTRRMGVEITKPDCAYRHPEKEWLHFNPDGWSQDERIFEAKTTDARNRRQWIDQIPDHAELQVHHGAAVTGATHAIVAALIGGNEFIVHEIEINPVVVDLLLEAEEKFWQYVTTDTPPPVDGHVSTMDALTRHWAHHSGSREIPESEIAPYWEAWVTADTQIKEAQAAKQAALAQITALMDGHDRLVTGDRLWARAQRSQLQIKRLEADHPELVEEFTQLIPALDRDAFRAAHPEIYAAYQGVSIRPQR